MKTGCVNRIIPALGSPPPSGLSNPKGENDEIVILGAGRIVWLMGDAAGAYESIACPANKGLSPGDR